jgi:hypothetical protein
MNQTDLRNKLINVIENGLVAKIIAQKTNIPQDVLSRFKNGKVCLCVSDAVRLERYLLLVQIPTSI